MKQASAVGWLLDVARSWFTIGVFCVLVTGCVALIYKACVAVWTFIV